EGAGQVGVNDCTPVVVGDLLQRTANLPDDSAGVVDQDVDAAEPGEEVPYLVGTGEVGGVLVDTMHDGSLVAECLSDGGADAVRCAGHDRRLAGQAGRWLLRSHFAHPFSS